MRLDVSRFRSYPRNCKRRVRVHEGHWETGKAGRRITTRKPGDLPAPSPNRWAGRTTRSGLSQR